MTLPESDACVAGNGSPATVEQRFRPFPSTRERPQPGEVLLLAERYEEALPFLERQLEDEGIESPRGAEILSNLGICYRISGRLNDSNNAYARALMRDPNNGTIWGNAALTMVDMGEHDAALKAATNAYRLSPSSHDVAFIYTLQLLREGRWTEAWPIWNWCRPKLGIHDNIIPPDSGLKQWHGEPFASGSRFLIVGEWGFGDAFMQLRYLGLLKDAGAHVTYISWKRQVSLFAGHPWIDAVHGYVKPGGDDPPTRLHVSDYDYYVCIMDLPSCFNDTPATVPHAESYLSIPPESLNGSLLPASRRRRIGICWQAEESAYSHRFRSYRDSEIAAFESVGAEWYSLQPGVALPWMMPHDPKEWRDSAALISQLDLVVTVDTAVAHLAGALGKPTWLLLPAGSAWQWLRDRKDSVWYKSMRVFRSDGPDDFLALPEQAARELR